MERKTTQKGLLITEDPAGHPLRPVIEPPEDELLGEEPSDEPETIAAPVTEKSFASHEAGDHGLSPQARLDAARTVESNLIAARPSLLNAQRAARAAVAEAVRQYQEHDPHRQDHESLAREFVRASQEQRAARARGEKWATPPERKPRGERAFVDIERAYSQGGDGNQFARRMNRTGNRRGAYPKQALGTINRDPSRGPVPAPVAPPRPTIPMLAGK